MKDKSILIKNIYYMLSYAFTVLKQGEYKDVGGEDFDNIHNLFAAILSKGISRQLKQGLYREYLNQSDDLPVLRGKLDVPGTIKNQISQKRLLSCEFDELSENNPFNRILKTTAWLLYSHKGVDEKYKSELKKEMLFFSDVDTVDLSAVRWDSLHFQRNNSTYQMLMGICRLIAEGLLRTDESGAYRLADFIDEQRMHALYERFILEYYKQHYPELKASAVGFDWAVDDGYKDKLPAMRTDITLSKCDRTLVIDAKYYTRAMQEQYGKSTIRSAHLYQIFAYVKNYSVRFSGEVAGMLLYAKTDEETFPDDEYMIIGNKISVKTLDLNCDFKEIQEQLDGIAAEYL